MLKWIVYLLVLLNLGLLLWHLRGKETNYDLPPLGEDEQYLRLVLLKEFQAERPKPNQLASATDDSSQPASQQCFTLGPFQSKAGAGAAKKQLGKAGIAAKQRVNKDKSRKGYWVILPPSATRAEANQHVKRLKQLEIKDYFLVVTGEKVNAVSLGVFSKSELAKQRLKTITELGFSAKIENVQLPIREYWLDWPKSQILPPELLDKVRAEDQGIGQTEYSCDLS